MRAPFDPFRGPLKGRWSIAVLLSSGAVLGTLAAAFAIPDQFGGGGLPHRAGYHDHALVESRDARALAAPRAAARAPLPMTESPTDPPEAVDRGARETAAEEVDPPAFALPAPPPAPEAAANALAEPGNAPQPFPKLVPHSVRLSDSVRDEPKAP